MEGLSRHGRSFSVSHAPVKPRSGYEPSDAETEWPESPRGDMNGDPRAESAAAARNVSPFKHSRRTLSSRFEFDNPSPAKAAGVSPVRRRHSKSPYKGHRGEVSPIISSDLRRNVSPVEGRDRRVSPFKEGEGRKLKKSDDGIGGSSRRRSHRPSVKQLEMEELPAQHHDLSRPSDTPHYSRRAVSNPRTRNRDQLHGLDSEEKKSGRTPSPLSRNHSRKEKEAPQLHAPSVGEINEMVAQAKLSRDLVCPDPDYETTDSIGDLFFSRDRTALKRQKDVLKPKIVNGRDATSDQRVRANGGYETHYQRNPSGSALSRSTSRQTRGRISSTSSRMSDASDRTTESVRNFTASRRKVQSEAWFGCMKSGSCRKSAKSPEQKRAFDEVLYIENAFVVEEIRQFWADKYQPASLNGFTCHRKEAQLLKELVSQDSCPHILLKGPPGSGKRSLVMALLREIFGDASWNISHEIRYFHIRDKRPMKVPVPLASSAHHVELNVNSDVNARYALMALVKEISNSYAVIPEVSNANLKAEYKVIILYDVDKAPESIQHLIKWVIDCYSDACKLILCCGDDVSILEPVKNRCQVISVDSPVTNEVTELLIQIARNEELDLPISFATKIATKSKRNLRKAIMALEACKANNYPFLDDQPIPLGWEEEVVELGTDILADPSPKRLFIIRGKFQKLLVDFVHPKLILQKLVEEFLKRVDSSVKREVYYWHAYYDKRLPSGTSALLKLEEFVAKFMSLYRKSLNHGI
uniref:Replication factor C subunit 3 n=1 Tax=Kalanchoe fedtschenkoi TaxID=63787 RepID=A0A7N0UBU3_KALFE